MRIRARTLLSLNLNCVLSCKNSIRNRIAHQQPIQYQIKVCCAQPRILMDPHRLLSAGCGSMRAKIIHKKERSEEIVCFKVLVFSYEGWRLLLRRPPWRTRDNWISIFWIKNMNFLKLVRVIFVIFYVMNSLDPELDPDPPWNQCGSTRLVAPLLGPV